MVKLNSQNWQACDAEALRGLLAGAAIPTAVKPEGEAWAQTHRFEVSPNGNQEAALLFPFTPENLGDPAFKAEYGSQYALYGGAMASAIASEAMVIALGKAGMLGSFGAGGLSPARIEKAIDLIEAALPSGNYFFNLLNSPFEPALERGAVELYLRRGVRAIEASAYLGITESLVLYRAKGLRSAPDGTVLIGNRIIAKISRREVAEKFLRPAPADTLAKLVSEGRISPEEARLAERMPMADDITVEADSGGHTDNRPLLSILPSIIGLRDLIQKEMAYRVPVRVGAGGGISTPEGALAAFMMGAAYVVTGSVNQACTEAGASAYTRKLLAEMTQTDVAMAPASDMFEMGVKVQVLKRGTMFAMRALKLYELYQRYESLEAIPEKEREDLEKKVFKMPLTNVWEQCIAFFSQRDPSQLERADASPKKKMALVFRWYLGLSSRWSSIGEAGREMDYQIWTGPSMGAFNDWVRGTYLDAFEERHVADVNLQILHGAAYLQKARQLENQGLKLPSSLRRYTPTEAIS